VSGVRAYCHYKTGAFVCMFRRNSPISPCLFEKLLIIRKTMNKLKHFIITQFVIFIFSIATMTVLADNSVPVMIGSDVPYLDACGSNGEVRGLNPYGDGFLAVRSGPGRQYEMIDRLYNGTQVYFCDEHGDWIGIVYGDPEQNCGVSSPVPRKQPYHGPCQSGWAHKNWLVLIAG